MTSLPGPLANQVSTSSAWGESHRKAMASPKRLADIGYKVFSGSMMLLTLYGGYLCSIRAYRYFQRREQLQLTAENQSEDTLKD
ncbi:hypothetical protein GDO86_004500 [Hymenochirus boettgeri]|uniref:Cytochrome c oxidase assembly factor COX14 n=1 Tax=Hymenochirus boettgeri TaxID=247094 RepID=A0A8T2KBG5_9PIPI|nr:hypothetical protein GDO86_004500 [Hymenochirus boettgeri]